MNDKRTRTIFTDRHNQDGMHTRCKNAITALNDVMKDAALVKYKRTLDEVAKVVTRALENDQKWSVKFNMLQAELDSNESRMKIALELSERDRNAISSLQNELKIAWNLIEELKQKNVIDFRQEICEDKDENYEATEQNDIIKKKENGRNADDNDRSREVKRKASDAETLIEKMTENQDKLQNEIERIKLQVFELEEELANKERNIEELTKALILKTNQLADITEESGKLKKSLDEVKLTNNKDVNKLDNCKELKLKETVYNLRRKLEDINRKDQISLEKVKHLIKKNKILNKQLQTTKNQNNLMRLELFEQTKMLDLLSCQFCKLEEKDKKQILTINELENVRNKYVHMVGNLEQEIHEIRKKTKF